MPEEGVKRFFFVTARRRFNAGLPVLMHQNSQCSSQADARCLVGLCASNATVLLTLHPSAQAREYSPGETDKRKVQACLASVKCCILGPQ